MSLVIGLALFRSCCFVEKKDKNMENPFLNIQNDLTLVKDILYSLCERMEKGTENNTIDRYEPGVQVACEELGTKPQTIYQNIDTIPHRKLHGKLYFNRQKLQEYIKNEGKK